MIMIADARINSNRPNPRVLTPSITDRLVGKLVGLLKCSTMEKLAKLARVELEANALSVAVGPSTGHSRTLIAERDLPCFVLSFRRSIWEGTGYLRKQGVVSISYVSCNYVNLSETRLT